MEMDFFSSWRAQGEPDLVRHWNDSDKLLPPVLTQGSVCATSYWHDTDISNKSDIHSQNRSHLGTSQLVRCGMLYSIAGLSFIPHD